MTTGTATMREARPTQGALMSIHAITGVHWGAGTSLGTVDLPIQRERHTGWPNGAGSAIKGVLRDACREILKDQNQSTRVQADETEVIKELFGSAKSGSEDTNAGSLSVTDARLLALPVRSLKGVFAWVTCPSVIERLQRDARIADLDCPLITALIDGNKVIVSEHCPLIVSDEYLQLDDETLHIERNSTSDAIATWISEHLFPANESYAGTRQRFIKQLVIVSDNVFTRQ